MLELKIEKNPQNGGLCCLFKHKKQEYYADLCYVHLVGTECMVFTAKDGKVTSWHDLYCKRGILVTEANLRGCIEEFIKELDEK